MTPRERILAALNHEPPDRTPTDGWFHPEVIESLKRHDQTDDWSVVLGELGIEGWVDVSPQLVPVDPNQSILAQFGPASGSPARWLDERTYEDVWGVRFRMDDDGPLDDPCHLFSIPWRIRGADLALPIGHRFFLLNCREVVGVRPRYSFLRG